MALEQFRQELDALDRQLVEIVCHRLSICQRIAEYKKEQGIPMMQPERIKQVKERCIVLGIEHGIRSQFVDELYTLLIQESCRLEDEIIASQRRLSS